MFVNQVARVVVCAMGMALVGTSAAASGDPDGRDGNTRVLVTATVLKRASLKVLAQPAAVVVTAEDIARGHVDVPSPALLAVNSNSGGYLLEFAGEGDFMRRIIVLGTGADVELHPGGGFVAHSRPGGGTSNLALTFRFVLSDAAQAGTYPWPLRLSVAPL